MRYRISALFLTALLALPTVARAQGEEYKTWKQGVKLQNITTVNVTLYRGSIAVRTTDADSILVSISARAKAELTAADWFKSTGVRIATTADALNLINLDTAQVMQPGITIDVPRSLKSLVIKINRSGLIYITGFGGSISASTPDGDVVLEHITGTALVNARDGDIRMTADKLTGKESAGIELLTLNGNIILTIPEKSSMTMKLETTRGTIFSDFLATQFKPFAGRLVSDGHGMMISTTVGAGVDYKGQYDGRNANNRMNADYKVESSVYNKDGGPSLTPIHLATINGSIIVTKSNPIVFTFGKPF